MFCLSFLLPVHSPASWAVTRHRISDVGLAMAAVTLRRPEEDAEIKISEELLQTTKHSSRPGLQPAVVMKSGSMAHLTFCVHTALLLLAVNF